MPHHGAINFTHMACDINKCREGAEIAAYCHSCLYLDVGNMKSNNVKYDAVIKEKDKHELLDEKPLSTIPKKLFM